MLPKILVVDDDVHSRTSVVDILSSLEAYDVFEASDGEDALRQLSSQDFAVVLSDMKMPRMDGITLLKEVVRRYPDTPFIIMTAYSEVEVAVKAMFMGAYNFIEKGSDLFIDKIEAVIPLAVERAELKRSSKRLVKENSNLRAALKERWQYVGKASSIQSIRTLAESVADSRSTILVTGESGTGKELIAKSIHAMSPRAGSPFIKINCAALPEGLIESELFGHEKGSFTGAIKSRVGKFELADGGSLLLDEIGEMPLSIQAKLLRVLQEREVDKVGGDMPVEVDVRIIATTNRDLAKEVEEGRFREDLFYRLNVFHFTLPPLCERKEDISDLVNHFIKRFNDENGYSVTGLSPDAQKALIEYSWPGNIRELENTIERAVVLTRSGDIPVDALLIRTLNRSKDGSGLVPGMTVAQAERELIYKTLDFCGNNKTRAAEMLDISIRTLRNKLHEYEGSAGEA